MTSAQRVALDLFEERGFENVTVAEVAEEAGMAASTLYRHFQTKEALVLWDEHDPGLDKALGRELGRRPPFEAMRNAFVAELGQAYEADPAFQLRRVQYIYRTEALHVAAVEDDFRDRAELTDALKSVLPRKQRSAAPILAGAALLALDVAFDRWQEADGTLPLTACIEEAFDQIADLNGFG
jgi:AcrR family transcriptional regulator